MSRAYKTPLLRSLAAELGKVETSQRLIEEIWAWYGPYGPGGYLDAKTQKVAQSTEGQKIIAALAMPDELRTKLQKHFDFDDSE